MTPAPYKTRRRPNYRLPIAVGTIAVLLIAGILIMAGGEDDPVTKSLVPPVASDQLSDEQQQQMADQAAAQSGAIDGAPLEKSDEPIGDDHEDEHHSAPPENEATNAGSLIPTATRFAELMINRPTDQLEAKELNKELITLATGNLATDLNDTTGDVATAQQPSEGEVLETILLDKDTRYGEILVVTRESLIDPTTRQKLDPTYINYVVRLDRLPNRGWAVTSWEPQL